MSRCQTSTNRGRRGHTLPRAIFTIFAFAMLIAGPLEAQSGRGAAQDGALSCNASIQLAAQGSPFFLNDKIRILADIGAGTIQGGSNILIDEFKYALDCTMGQTIENCIAEGNQVTLDDLNITTDCVNSSDGPPPVIWQVTEANVRTFTPTSGLPIVVPANNTCRVEFDVSVHELTGDDNIVRQSLGWTSRDARCDNRLPASANSSINLAIQECGIDMSKEVSVDGGATWHDANTPSLDTVLEVGGDAMYRLSVENTGTVGYVQPIDIVDASLNINTTIPALAAGASTVIDGSTIPALNVQNRCQTFGFLENVSSAEGSCRAGGNPVSASASDNAWVFCVPPAGIQIRKEISIDQGTTWLDANTPGTAPVANYPSGAEYRLTVTNPGPGGLDDVVVNDATLNIVDFAVGSLAAGASVQLTSAEIGALAVAERCDAAGTYNNVATADGVSAVSGNAVPQASDPANLVCVDAPEIDILKEISVDGGATWHDANSADAAPVVEYPSGAMYRLTVTNTGNIDLVNVEVDDATLGISHSVGSLASGASVQLDAGTIGALNVPQRCEAAGTLINTATADGDSADNGAPAPQASDPAVLVCVDPPEINVLKEISVDGGATWHDANTAGTAPVVDAPANAEYRITASNPGPTDLVGVVVNDLTLGIANHAVGNLAAGASVLLDSGSIAALGVAQRCSEATTFTNTATADGDSAETGSPAPQASDPAVLVCAEPGSIQVVKEISVDGGGTWHDANSVGTAPVVDFPGSAEYRITVNNPGPTDLANVVVNDAVLNIVNHSVGNLASGASVVLGSGDIGALGTAERCDSATTVTNIATADGDSADTGTPVPQASDPANLVCVDPPAINVLKEISVDGGTTWHDANGAGTAPVAELPGSAEYRITVNNPGPTDLVDVVVNDAMLGIVNHTVGNLASGASVVLDSGDIGVLGATERCDSATTFTNLATADGDSAETGTAAPQASDPAVLVCTDSAQIAILKEISVDGGATWEDANSPVTAPVVDYPANAEYRITVSNPGLSDLVDVVVNDATLSIVDYAVGNLASGASVVLGSGEIAALGSAERCDEATTVTNIATADGDSADTGNPAPQATDPANLVCVDPPAVLVLKEISVDGGTTWEDANSAVTAPIVTFPSGAEYRITVTNPGPTDLVGVVVNDTQLNIVDYLVGDLDAGVSVELDSGDIAELGVAQVCGEAGDFSNVATADGDSADTGTAAPQASDPAVLLCIGTPSIDLTKEISVDDGATWHDANDLNTAAIAVFPSPALYRLTVTNNGTSPLTGVVVSDADLGINEHPVGDLAIGEIVVLTVLEISELSVSQACDARGTFINNSSTSGISAEDLSPVNDSDPAYLVCVGEPHLSIVKEISVDNGVTWFDDAPPPQPFPVDALYRISVTNDGTAPLEDVTVDDLTVGVADYYVGDLAVGQTVVLTEDEIPELFFEDRCTNGGNFMNTASAVGISVDFPFADASDSDMANLECIGEPMVDLEKEISVDGGKTYVDADDMNTAAIAVAPADAHYRFIVRNVGPVALTNILLTDLTLGIVDYPLSDLAVGAEVTIDSGTLQALFVEDRCTGVGTFVNNASVSAESADGTGTNDSDPAWLACVGTPDIQIVKEISTNGGLHWFDDSSTAELPPATALYRLTVTNTGTSDLDDVEVSDTTLGISEFPVGFLATGDSVLLTNKDIPALSTTNRCTSPGEYVNIASTSGTSLNFPFETVNDSDPATLVCIQFADVCEPNKPAKLTVQYDADSDSSHNQSSNEVVIDPPNAVFPDSVYIEVYGHIGDFIASHANVQPGYVFDVVGPRPRIPPRLTFQIYTAPGGSLIQTVQFHSSCSEPLETGDEFGAITIVAGIN